MAEATAQTVLGKISQGHLECPICFCRFKDPKILDCLHSFCLNCLDEMFSKQQPETDKITCPVCRRETQVPGTGLHSLSNCFFLSSLVEEVNMQEQALGDAPAATSTCECAEGFEAIWMCLHCNENICQKCQEAHKRVKYTKNHSIILVQDLHKVSVSPTTSGKEIAPKCTRHADLALCFYCDTCDVLICAMCAATDHRSAEHTFNEIAESVASFRENVDGILQKFQTCKEQFTTTNGSIEHAKNRLENTVARACTDISAKAEEEIRKIRNKARLLTEKVTEIGRERGETYEKALNSNRDMMERADQVISAVTDLLQQADDFELLDLKPKINHNLEFQKELEFEQAEFGQSYIGVKCQDVVMDSDLGEVLYEEKWQLKEEFGKEGTGDGEFKFGRGVACFSNGDIVVADTNRHVLSIFTSTGRYKTKIPQGTDKHALTAPWGVAVTCDDLLFVTDKRQVKVFDNNLKWIREFTPAQDDTENQLKSSLNAIAADKMGKWLAVADSGRKLVSLHNPDGSLIKTIPNEMVSLDLAINNSDLLFIPNYDGQRLLCVDLADNEVFSIGTSVRNNPAKPTGIICNDTGDFYVAVHYGNRGSFEVQHYDPYGLFIGTVAEGLYNPLEMTVTPAGDVVIADKHSFKIFQRL